MFLKFIIPLIIFSAILFGVNFFSYFSIIRFFNIASASLKNILIIALSFLSASFFISVILSRIWENFLTRGFYFISSFWIGFLMNLIMAFILAWLVVLIFNIFHYKADFLIGCFFVFLAIAFSFYGVWNAYNPRVKNIDVKIKNLPEQWMGKKIIQVSDLHLGHNNRVRFLENVVEKINAENPEMVLITGDLFDGMGDGIEDFVEPLNKIKSPAYFITGNHENYLGAERALNVIKKTKIRIFDDEVGQINGLQLIGIGYPAFGQSKKGSEVIKANKNFKSGEPTILMYHTPTSIDQASNGVADSQSSAYWRPDLDYEAAKALGVNLQLSGHTHAGQMIPFTFIADFIYKGSNYGLYEDGDFSLYTTNGTGTWGPPMRTGNMPEIVVIRLE